MICAMPQVILSLCISYPVMSNIYFHFFLILGWRVNLFWPMTPSNINFMNRIDQTHLGIVEIWFRKRRRKYKFVAPCSCPAERWVQENKDAYSWCQKIEKYVGLVFKMNPKFEKWWSHYSNVLPIGFVYSHTVL